jgi:transcription initiation factor TFIIB
MSFPVARVLSPGEIVEEDDNALKADPEWRMPLAVRLVCPECQIDPPNLVEETSAGDTICADCGLVSHSLCHIL